MGSLYDASSSVECPEEQSMAKVNPIQIQKFLKGMNYPASKEEVISHAKEHGADKEVLNTLNRMSDDEFETPADVSKAIGDVE